MIVNAIIDNEWINIRWINLVNNKKQASLLLSNSALTRLLQEQRLAIHRLPPPSIATGTHAPNGPTSSTLHITTACCGCAVTIHYPYPYMYMYFCSWLSASSSGFGLYCTVDIMRFLVKFVNANFRSPMRPSRKEEGLVMSQGIRMLLHRLSFWEIWIEIIRIQGSIS